MKILLSDLRMLLVEYDFSRLELEEFIDYVTFVWSFGWFSSRSWKDASSLAGAALVYSYLCGIATYCWLLLEKMDCVT